MPPLISFIVPCYNYGRYLTDCVSSILAQEGSFEYEVILIDDASTDDTAEVLGGFADDRLRVISHATNRGHAETITEGVLEARGAFVARIDPDDRYRPYFLSEVVHKLVAHPEVGLVYGDAALIDDAGRITAERSDRVHRGDSRQNEFIRLLENNFICAPTVIARREAWTQALPVPRGLAFNDWYFWLMMARRWAFYYVDRVLADYRVHSRNLHTQIARDGSEEASILRVLDAIYGECEGLPDLEQQKRRVKRRVYGAHYLTLANKYFGFGMNSDARRCYLSAIANSPRFVLRPEVARRVAATCMARETYDASKALIKAARSLGRGAAN